jgi:hypothetical protein
VADYRKDWAKQKEIIAEIREMCVQVPFATTLVLNMLTFHPFCFLVMFAAGLSWQTMIFWAVVHVIPGTAYCMVTYYRKYGPAAFAINPSTLSAYFNNWVIAMSLCGTSWLQWLLCFVLEIVIVEPYLPDFLQGSVVFPLPVVEASLKHSLYFMYGFSAFLLLTVNLWVRGYNMNASLVGLSKTLSRREAALEILYFAAQTGAAFQFYIPFGALLTRMGTPIRYVHLLFFTSDLVCSQQFGAQFSFLHQIMHEVTPLYSLMHAEHHEARGIYPNNNGSGLWEILLTIPLFFFSLGAMLPYGIATSLHCGVGTLAHTMWPWESMVQWHTMHHVIKADIYSAGVPTNGDMVKSKIYQNVGHLQKISPFIRNGWLLDAVGFGMMVVANTVLYYTFGTTIFSVWSQRIQA